MTRASEFLSAPTRHPASLAAFRQEIDTAARRIADNAETAHDYASTAWASVLAAARSGRYAAKVQDDSMPRLIANNTCKNGQPNLASVARKLKRNKSTVSRRLEKLRSRHEDVLEEWFVAMTSKLHQLTTETRTRLEDWILRRVDL